MIPFILWLLAPLVAPDLDRLGRDDWRVREAETARLDNVLSALLLPADHDDPEVLYRVRYLRTRNLNWLNPVGIEHRIYRADTGAWIELYLRSNRSAIDAEWNTFADLHADPHKARAVFNVWPVGPAENEGFLFGHICPGEYERWLAHRCYHRRIAPEPRDRSAGLGAQNRD